MSLLDRVRKDAQRIMNSNTFGFGTDAILIDPDGTQYPMKSIISVIHNLVDPDTGQPVSGYLATASLNRLNIPLAKREELQGISEHDRRPWLLQETNIDGVDITYKVTRAAPDEANGNILCDLGAYGY